MKPLISLTGCCLLLAINTGAQELSKEPTIAILAGVVNYQGDLNPNSFTFNHSHFSAGVMIRKPLNRWLTARAGFNIGKIEAADRYNREYLKPRNLSFYNTITELNLGFELNVLDISTKHFTPYLLGGLAFFHSNPWTYDNAGKKVFLQPLSTEGQGLSQFPDQKPYGFYHMALMFGGGCKVQVSDALNIGLEFSQRKSFTDYIDDVSTHFVDRDILLQERGQLAVDIAYRGDEVSSGSPIYPNHGEQRGTPSEMDWYYYFGATVEVKLQSLAGLFKSVSRTHGGYSLRCPRNVTGWR